MGGRQASVLLLLFGLLAATSAEDPLRKGKCSGPYEAYSECARCSNDALCPSQRDPAAGACPPNCNYGCDCVSGYSRFDGLCIPNSDPRCSSLPRCPKNEFWNECGSFCGSDNCPDSSPGIPIGTDCIEVCKEGCFCQKGFARNKEGVCIPLSECPIAQCNKNEIYTECGPACADAERCPALRAPDWGCAAVCVPGCFCAPGYFRFDGECIPESKCPVTRCQGENEAYTDCGPSCGDDRCQAFKDPGIACTLECRSGCFCAPGFARDYNGVCVPECQCPALCNGTSEYLNTCGPACCELELCPSQRPQDFGCIERCDLKCTCASGYYRSDQGHCIPESECPSASCPGPNEQYTDCGPSCGDDRCTALKDPGVLCTLECRSGCFCAPGFQRDQSGVCVPECSCPAPCSGQNEFLNTCGPACPELENCPNRIPTDLLCADVCVEKCTCASGYSRNEQGVCIPDSECPPTTECPGLYEEFTDCMPMCSDQCQSLQDPGIFCTAVCRSGCACKQGYARGPEGVCIPVETCPPSCSGPNEYLNTCGPSCYAAELCPALQPSDLVCTANCVRKCTCATSYFRNATGTCVFQGDCPTTGPCSGPNEILSSCVRCGDDQVCPSERKGLLCAAVCREGCDCKQGYLRSKGVCILEKQCPA